MPRHQKEEGRWFSSDNVTYGKAVGALATQPTQIGVRCAYHTGSNNYEMLIFLCRPSVDVQHLVELHRHDPAYFSAEEIVQDGSPRIESIIHESDDDDPESLIRCMFDWIGSHKGEVAFDYDDVERCIRVTYRFQKRILEGVLSLELARHFFAIDPTVTAAANEEAAAK